MNDNYERPYNEQDRINYEIKKETIRTLLHCLEDSLIKEQLELKLDQIFDLYKQLDMDYYLAVQRLRDEGKE